MSIDGMRDTRRSGQRKRVDVFTTLANQARAEVWSTRQIREAIDQAVSAATGLTTKASRDEFRRQCELITDSDVLDNFDTILAFSERVWNSRKTRLHSLQHVMLSVAKEVARYSATTTGTDRLRRMEARFDQDGWFG